MFLTMEIMKITEVNELQETTFNSLSSTNFCGELSSEQDKSP